MLFGAELDARADLADLRRLLDGVYRESLSRKRQRGEVVKAGLEIGSDPLEAHYLAGGSVDQVVLALIAADKAGISLDFNRACAIDLATKGPERPCSKRCARASIRK